MKIVVTEDDKWYREFLVYHIELNPDHEVIPCENGKSLLNALKENPDVICLDYSLPDYSGEELLQLIHQKNEETHVIVISGQEDISTAVKLLRLGAYDYITKDDETSERLWNVLLKIQENQALKKEIKTLRKEVGKKFGNAVNFIGESKEIIEVKAIIEKAAKTNIAVSIHGETGTGKELVAKAIHYAYSPDKPFIAVNVAAIPKELIESELFGHEKGSFTGANSRRLGKFEEANGGTIFLDEIAEMDLNLQSKLLRVLQEKEVTRIGSNTPIKLSFKLITATHKNLSDEIKNNRFREDLFYRLMGIPIEIPALRNRKGDIPSIASYFIEAFCKNNDIEPKKLSTESIEKLKNYAFPGNVRELKAVIELAIVMADNDFITPEDIRIQPRELSTEELLKSQLSLREYTNIIIQHHLDKNNYNILKVADLLNVGKSTLYRMVQSGDIYVPN